MHILLNTSRTWDRAWAEIKSERTQAAGQQNHCGRLLPARKEQIHGPVTKNWTAIMNLQAWNNDRLSDKWNGRWLLPQEMKSREDLLHRADWQLRMRPRWRNREVNRRREQNWGKWRRWGGDRKTAGGGGWKLGHGEDDDSWVDQCCGRQGRTTIRESKVARPKRFGPDWAEPNQRQSEDLMWRSTRDLENGLVCSARGREKSPGGKWKPRVERRRLQR
jgi:hypothetical protein